MNKIFFIPGLGANEKVFDNIGDLNCDQIKIKWLDNLEDESINEYSRRLIEAYDIGENDIVAGLSFGGILAQEIARILYHKEVILISSFRDIKDLKPLYRFGLKTGLYKLTPGFRIPIVDEIIAYNLNSENQESKPILKEMLEHTDYNLLKWSLEKIAQLPSASNDSFITHNIIGNNDKILQTWSNEYTTIIEGGSHFMVYEKADEVTSTILKILSNSKDY